MNKQMSGINPLREICTYPIGMQWLSAGSEQFFMSCPTHLQHFIQTVPVCLQTATVGHLWSIFCQGNGDRVVVVNQQHQPVGLVRLYRMMPDLFQQTPHLPFRRLGTHDLSAQTQTQLDRQQLRYKLRESWIEPLLDVPARFNWLEFWQHLRQSTPEAQLYSSISAAPKTQPLALVDAQGQFLGLLDSLKLLKFLAVNPQLLRSNAELTPKRNAPHPETESTPVSRDGIPPSLLQLLEQLPIPLTIQTSEGKIIAQNRSWRSQLGTQPQQVQDTANLVAQWTAQQPTTQDWPNSRPLETASSSLSSDDSPSFSFVSAPQTSDREQASESGEGVSLPNWCQLGTQPHTYVCVCSVPNSQERVWQFARQPLQGNLLSPDSQHLNLNPPTPKLWVVLAQDITEQHRVAQELTAKNADLVQLNRLKDEFLACISHELKTPLTAVLGLSSLLKDQAIGNLNDRQARYAQLIHQSGRHLMMVVNDILDLTRMETGQLELIPEPVHIQAVCDRAFHLAEQLHAKTEQSQKSSGSETASAPQQRFSLEIESGLEVIVADEVRLRQMLVNLLSNALKFTPDEGEIGLRVTRWENWIAFTVWDTGIGIPEDKQNLIFQKFQQLENPLTRKFEGTGLGLVLTQRLARLHGGDVSFISKQDQGSQFTLLLPPSPPQKKDWGLDTRDWKPNFPPSQARRSQMDSPRSTPQAQSRIVLIVEAVPRFIESLSDQLISLGYRVVIARAGTEALEKARCLQPRVIFLNPLLPLLSGWDVLTLLKTNAHTAQIPVIITATLGEKKRAVLNHCDGFLSLPVQKEQLQEILTETQQYPEFCSEQKLTLLWLNPVDLDRVSSVQPHQLSTQFELSNSPTLTPDSSAILHRFSNCRIVEADDLDQAELLSRIWHPDVIILPGTEGVKNPAAFLQQLSQKETLVNIPLITLARHTTQLANQIKNLSVFPCLVFEHSADNTQTEANSEPLELALLQVIQVAARINCKPNILVIDFSTLPDLALSALDVSVMDSVADSANFSVNSSEMLRDQTERDTLSSDPTAQVERAIVQYLQTAGFRGSMAQSWAEVLQQIQCQSVDLLLICMRDISPKLLQALTTLETLQTKPTILILDHSSFNPEANPQNPLNLSLEILKDNLIQNLSEHLCEQVEHLINNMKIQVIPGHISMTDLLEKIKQNLQVKKEQS